MAIEEYKAYCIDNGQGSYKAPFRDNITLIKAPFCGIVTIANKSPCLDKDRGMFYVKSHVQLYLISLF